MPDLYGITKQRLESYGLFSEATIEKVSRLAQSQTQYAQYRDFLRAVGMPEVKLFSSRKNGAVPYVDIPAKTEQEMGTMVIHLPMGNPLDPNQLYQVAILAAAHPEYRVISFGNPSGKVYRYRRQNLTFKKRWAIAFTDNRLPLVAAELEYLESLKLTDVWHVGYSFGALKALVSAQYMDQRALRGLITLDPVAHPRGIKQLVDDFLSTEQSLNKYIDRTQDELFLQARRDTGITKHYNWGLFRQISVAIGIMLARTDFLELLKSVLQSNPSLNMLTSWGGLSELGNDAHMGVTLHDLKKEFPGLRSMRLKDDVHAFANDVYLHAAIISEGLSTKSSTARP